MIRGVLASIRRVCDSREQRRRCLLARRKLASLPRPLRLHIGCGTNHFPGWTHLGMNAALPHVDALWHSADGLPCEDATCQFIYSEHFLEHLNISEGRAFLRECHRALQPGGVVRIAMPDLRDCVSQYWNNNWCEQPWLKVHGYEWIATGAEYLNIAMRDWGHQWLYDREELRRRLSEAGFAIVRDVAWGESDTPELRGLETRPESVLVCEASRS